MIEIKLDPDDIKVSCLNLPDNQLPVEMVAFIRKSAPNYKDWSESLAEDMYTVDDTLDALSDYDTNGKYAEHMTALMELMGVHGCSYFRLIKM